MINKRQLELKIFSIAVVMSLLGTSYSLAQTSPFYSSKLLVPKLFSGQTARFTKNTSYPKYHADLFSRPYGISSIIYNDPVISQNTNMEVTGSTDANWDRCGIYCSKWDSIDVVGDHGVDSFQTASPKGIAADAAQIFLSDTYNNRVHVYNISLNPLSARFRGFDSLARPHDLAPATPLRTPLGIDRVNYFAHTSTDSFFVKHIAVADYGNNRVVIFPSTFSGGSIGREYGGFSKPTAVAYAYDKISGKQRTELFVVSQGDGRISWLKLDKPLSGTPPNLLATIPYDFNRMVSQGLAQPNFYLSSATVDNHGLLWILDSNSGTVYKFWPTNNFGNDSLIFLGSWGGLGTADGQLNYPNGIAAQHGIKVIQVAQDSFAAIPLTPYPNDILVTETWGPQTGVRRFGIGIEAFADSAKYKPKNNQGGNNYVDFFYRLTDYANVTGKVYLGANLIDTLPNGGERTPGTNSARWFVQANGSGNYRLEVVTASQYGGVSDTIEFNVAVDTSRRSNPPQIDQLPHFVASCPCFFPTRMASGTDSALQGGGWVKAHASDADLDPLTYNWRTDTGFVGLGPLLGGSWQLEFCCWDSVFFGVPAEWQPPAAPPPGGSVPEDLPRFIRLTVSDPDGNRSQQQNLSIPTVICPRGDMDADSNHTASDVILMLNGVFLGQAPPVYGDYEAAGDMNCDGLMDATDVVRLLNRVFLGAVTPC